ncbi:MAG: hypothetical protein HKM07_02515, partial [Chlamydiae bacterium]|nr:hypothetical protein [Chlamydiota bacterium]
ITSLTFLNFLHADISYETNARKHFRKEGEKLAKKYDLKIIGNGLGQILVDAKQGTWTLSFTSEKALTLEQVRPIVADISFTLLHALYHDPIYPEYYKRRREEGDPHVPPLNDDEIGFKLAFWDKNVNRPLYPYLAQVRLADSNIYYYYANPKSQALESPTIESLKSLKLPDYK